MTPTEAIFIEKEESGLRLDKLLSLRFPNLSRSYFQSLIEKGLVLVNGTSVKKREKPILGDEIEICFELPDEIQLEPEDIPLNILFEDDHLLVVNKPHGMVVHPAPGHPKSTFVNALLFHCKNLQAQQGSLRPGIVHRLDKDTSGVLIAAKTTEAHRALVSMLSERKMQKTYVAVALGTPKEGRLSAPIKRHCFRRQEMAVDPEGKEAISDIKVLKKSETLSVVEIGLITGRTHQIRVHLKHLQTPVLGDCLYGSPTANKKYKAQRQLLHAARVKFIHPFTHQEMVFQAPLPSDLLPYWKNLP